MKRIVTLILLIILAYSINFAQANSHQDDVLLSDELLKLQQNFTVQQGEELQPFIVTTTTQDRTINFNFTLQNNSYIYKDYFNITSDNKIKYSISSLPNGILHEVLQGSNYILNNDFTLSVTILEAKKGDTLTLNYQGCSADGICYPPMSYSYNLTDDYPYQDIANTAISTTDTNSDFSLDKLLGSNFALALIAAIAFGMLLNLTPCVIPMLPIFSAMITGNKSSSLKRNISINTAYALGLSLSYMVLGLLLSLLGAQLQAVLQNAITLYIMAALIFILALSSAGLFDIKLPSALSAKIQNKAITFNKGSLVSAFGFGVLSSILATPCTSAPLAGVVLYVLQDGNMLKGMLTFWCLGIGMAIPLFLIGIFGSKLFAKVKTKSIIIKKLIAAILFALCIYLIRNHLGMYQDVIINLSITGISFYAIFSILHELKANRWLINTSLAAVISLVITFAYTQYAMSQKIITPFTQIQSIEQIDLQDRQKIYLNFSASWCSNCVALKKYVYSQEKFKNLVAKHKFKLYEIELNDFSDSKTQELIQRYNIIGVPTFIILDNNLNTIASGVGFLSFEEIEKIINNI